MKEKEVAHHSNYINLQVEEILKSCKISAKQEQRIEDFLKELHSNILQFSKIPNQKISTISWMKTDFPLPGNYPANLDIPVSWFPPADVKLLGSYQLKTALKDDLNIDVVLEMPKQCLGKKAYLNHQYFLKRSFYLVYVARELSKLYSDISISYFMQDVLKPVVLLSLPCGFGTVRIHACPPSDYFNDIRLFPDVNNMSKSSSESDAQTVALAVAHYNNSILVDMKMSFHLDFLYQLIKSNTALQNAIQLLKLWLKQRKFDQGHGCFNGFVMSMFVALLLYTDRLNTNMNCFQMFRFVLKSLGLTEWAEAGAAFETVSHLNLFHKHHEVVFLDPSGTLNLCASMSAIFYHQVVHEANVSFTLLDKHQSNVYKIFMEPILFPLKFDIVFCISNLKEVEFHHEHFEESLSLLPSLLKSINKSLKEGLGQRVELIGIRPHFYKPWLLSSSGPAWHETFFTFGLLLNKGEFDEPLTKGPSADSPEAATFREFWGSVAELRRFKDGSICEAVVWEKARKIPEQICKYLLKRHCGIPPTSVVFSSLDEMLPNANDLSAENGVEVRIAYQDLCHQLTSFKTLPLSITNIHGLSPVLRATELFPPQKISCSFHIYAVKTENGSFCAPFPVDQMPQCPKATEILCFFESSRSWPQERQAIQRVKAAFNEAITKELRSAGLPAYATAKYVYFLKNGFPFKLKVGYQREVNVLQSQTTETGLRIKKENPESLELETEIFHFPRLAANLDGISRQFGAFGDTCRLAKKWLGSHLLSNHISDEAVDLLCAYLFLYPAPYLPPGSAQSGFLRFLQLLATFSFSSAPLLIDFKSSFSDRDRISMVSYFTAHRDILPPICILTSVNRKRSLWTEQNPAAMVLNRMRKLARLHIDKVIDMFLSATSSWNIKSYFTPSFKTYDVLIHLRQFASSGVALDMEKNLPVVDFDSASIYLKQLEHSYSEYATFFHGRSSGDVIAVMWRPAAFQAVPFRIMSLSCRKVDEQGNLVPNLEAIIEDFKVLGCGLVEAVELRTNKWKM